MRKILLLAMTLGLGLLILATPALAAQVPFGPPATGYSAPTTPTLKGVDQDIPWGDPNCQVCHGEVENNFNPWVSDQGSTSQTTTLRNIVKFNNLYVLEAMKVEKDSNNGTNGTTPTIDLGDASPLQPATDHFWTRIASNAPYTETFSWDDFRGPNGNTLVNGSAAWLTVKVFDSDTLPNTQQVANGGVHPNSGNHPPTNPSNWEVVNLTVTPPWTALPGAYWNTLDIVVTQQ